MNLVVISIALVSIVLGPVETRFYLEIIDVSVDATNLFEKIIKAGIGEPKVLQAEAKEKRVQLYECKESPYVGTTVENACERVWEPEQREKIHAQTNFYRVPMLEFFGGHFFKIEGEVYFNQLPQALAIGLESIGEKYLTHATKNWISWDPVKDLVKRNLARFVKSDQQYQNILFFFSCVHYQYFKSHIPETRDVFEHYATVLQRVMKEPMYEKAVGSALREKKTQSCLDLCSLTKWATSKPQKKERSSPGFCSPMKCAIRALISPKCRPHARSGATQNGLERSESQDQSILEAANLLAFKMLDPCLYFYKAGLEKKEAEPYCATYCQFISATMQVYGLKDHKECESLKKGYCVVSDCKCLPHSGAYAKSVNMVQCNNVLRLHIYQQAGLIYSPEDESAETQQ